MQTPAAPIDVRACFDLKYGPAPENRLHLFVPEVADKPPLVVYIHGGGWTGGSLEQYDAHCVRTVCEGLAAATIEYRFLDKAPLDQIVADAARACMFLASSATTRGYDATRMILMGSSAGGHLALMVAARWEQLQSELDLPRLPRPLGVIAQCPVTTFEGPEGDPDRDRRRKLVEKIPLERVSPCHLSPDRFPPVQVQHGDADDLVPFSDSEAFRNHLARGGASAELITLPGVGHGFGYNLATGPGKSGLQHALSFIRARCGTT
jgi:acetyl esterase/lipase